MKKFVIHKTADVKSKSIGNGTVIWQYCVILEGATIGKNCNINCMVFIENHVKIGSNVTVKPGVQIWDGITIEDNVFIGPNVTFTNDLVPRSKQYPKNFEKTIIKKGASIGANSTIIAGTTIGAYSLIGAGSVVTKSTPDYSVFYGNPATHRGFVTKDGLLLDLNLRFNKEKYQFENNELIKQND